ncbi:hypothetical protein [Thalassoglobus neptunius]|nr:hypothetical protein [Thalassoglobus neptunius]
MSQFCVDKFLALSGAELHEYSEPFVNELHDAIPEAVYESLQSKLQDLDEEHTIYALELNMLLKPNEFVGFAIPYLSHSDSAVCCTAYRTIERQPTSLITNDLCNQIRATPIVDLFSTHVRTGEKVLVGTNEEFIRNLLAKIA